MKGRLLLERATTEKEFRAGIELFKQTTELDAVYAPGWAGLAEATWSLAATGFEFVPPASVRDEALSAAKKALDSTSSFRKLTTLGLRSQPTGSGTRKRMSPLEEGDRLRPSYAAAYNWYGQLLVNFTNRFDEAREHFTIARGLDPFSPWNDINGCVSLLFENRFNRAIEECGRTLARDPGISSSAGSGAMPFWL